MATKGGTTLKLYFKDAGDDPMTLNFPYADEDATDAQVKALADACVTNRLMWNAAPTTKVGAELVTTTVVEVDIED